MKDLGEADVILGINFFNYQFELVVTQPNYIQKFLKTFNNFNNTSTPTPLDPSVKLFRSQGIVANQLKYSQLIGNLVSVMYCIRPDITYTASMLANTLVILGENIGMHL